MARSTYVEVATQKFGKRGRPTNVSRTAVLTGLARREVRKQRERLQAGPDVLPGYVTKASLVLSAWHLDPDFIDKSGKPTLLHLTGDEGSFSELLRRCGGGDIRATTLLRELVSAGAVRQRPDGKLEALQRSYIPHSMDEQLIRLWGTVLSDVAGTFAHNLTRPPRTPRRFERAAVNSRVAASALPEFRLFLEREGQAFLERVDAWLTAHEVPESAHAAEGESLRLGAGMYHIQD